MKDPYSVVRRVDWIREQLTVGRPLNSTAIVAEFGVTWRTALRDIKYLKKYFDGRLKYDYREKTFYLD